MNKEVKQGQSAINKVLELYGSIEGVIDWSILNGLSITEPLEIGKEVKGGVVLNKNTVMELQERPPATALTQALAEAPNQSAGIGMMVIETNFIVN